MGQLTRACSLLTGQHSVTIFAFQSSYHSSPTQTKCDISPTAFQGLILTNLNLINAHRAGLSSSRVSFLTFLDSELTKRCLKSSLPTQRHISVSWNMLPQFCDISPHCHMKPFHALKLFSISQYFNIYIIGVESCCPGAHIRSNV